MTTLAQPVDAHAEEDGLPLPRRALAALAVIATVVLVVLDGAIANVALPAIAGALAAPPAATVWVVTGYQVALVMALLPCAALGEGTGYRGVFAAGVVVFVAASAGCALAPSLPLLVACRFVQGLGGAAVMGLGVAMLRFIYPQRLLGAAIGWNALAIALAGAAGPAIGAAILAVAGWPFLFAVNIPVGLVVLLAARALPRPPASGRRPDPASTALNAAGFAACVVGVDQLVPHAAPPHSAPPHSARPHLALPHLELGLALLAGGALCLALLVRRDWRREAPLVPLDLLRARPFRLAVLASVCCFTGQMAGMVALPFLLQHGLGQDAMRTGLLMTPWPLTVAVAAPLSGRLADRFGTAWLCAGGGGCLAAGLALAALWPLHGEALLLVPFTMLAGLGFGLFQTPNNRTMLLAAPKARSGAAGGMQGTARLLGQTLGSVAMMVLFGLAPEGTAPRAGLALAAIAALLAALVSARRIGGTSGGTGPA
jgi:MFS transporter, DHA2 family, multidrug resistance protein